MKRRWWVLVACAIVLVGLVLLAPSLDDLRFEPAKPFGMPSNPLRPISFPSLSIPEDTPIWKILVFWLAFVVNLAMFFLLLPPELRKKILRQVISFALGVLLIVLALRYRMLQLPELVAEPAASGDSGISGPPIPADMPAFVPPQVASWVTFAVSVFILWLILLAVYTAYRYWRNSRQRRSPALEAIAEIARSSLADLAAGREWGDVVLQAYARMTDVLRTTRGLQRESSSTPREFAARLARTGLPSSSIDELTHLFESVRYGGRVSDAGDARRAAACLESILQACGAAA